jgi:hypothetical protein
MPQSCSGPASQRASREASSYLAGTAPSVVMAITVVALLELAQRQNGLCLFQTLPLAFAFHPVPYYGISCRLYDTHPNGQARGQVCVILHPTPVAVAEGDDVHEGLPHRLPELLLHQNLSPSSADVFPSAAKNFGQLLVHPAASL